MSMQFLNHLQFWKKPEQPNVASPQRRASLKVKMLGQYEILREIGRGSMGVVYLGWDRLNRRDAALKTMSLASEFDQHALEDAKARFMREAEFLDTLNHPNIVDFYSAGEEHGLAYIAMEFLRGVELTEYTKPGSLLPLPTLLEIMERAAEALGYAHEQKIVHRDVKPGNIMYDAGSNVIKMADFGISRLTNLSRTRTGVVLGSPYYMSPEQVVGDKVNGQSDLFSLGATFYQLVSGHLPFKGETDMQVMYSITQDPTPDISTIRPDLPQGIRAIINRALAKNTAERFNNGYEMAQAIRRCALAL